jgi:hypothetical protein
MSAPNSIRTGGEIDAFCSKCELNLAHTIVAMVGPKVVKVKCNTCGADHVYRGQQPLVKAQSFAAPKKSAGVRTPRAQAVVVSTWEERLKGKDVSRARRYSPKETFVLDEVVDHPTLGLGLVTAVRGDKVDIAFKQYDRTLVHGKPDHAHRPAYAPPRAAGAHGFADKPEQHGPPLSIDSAEG